MPATAAGRTDNPVRSALRPDRPPHVTEPAVTEARSTPRRRRGRSLKPTRAMLVSRLGADVYAYLDKLSLAQLLCLAYGHTWPVLIPGRGRPRGWRAVLAPEREGAFLITEECTRDDAGSGCQTVRTTYTGENGIFADRGKSRQYRYDNDVWEVRPEGSRITRLDVLDYIMARMGDELFAEPAQGEGALA